jgi:hypothetical protein
MTFVHNFYKGSMSHDKEGDIITRKFHTKQNIYCNVCKKQLNGEEAFLCLNDIDQMAFCKIHNDMDLWHMRHYNTFIEDGKIKISKDPTDINDEAKPHEHMFVEITEDD